MTNAIAIARNLVAAGIEQKAADAIAEVVVTHSDEHLATKADIADLRGKMDSQFIEIKTQMKLLMTLVGGLYIGLALLFVDRLEG